MFICFHNPDEPNGYLSNWYLSDFVYRGIKFSSAEQYMMYCKAILFQDTFIAQHILATSDVGQIKALGRQVSNFDSALWDRRKLSIMIDGLYCKFSQNTELCSKLLSTGTEILCECAVHDRIWGIGLSMKDENRFNKSKWRGENLLGEALMHVRAVLMQQR